MKSQLLANTAMLPATKAKLGSVQISTGAIPATIAAPARLALGLDQRPKAGLRRVFTTGGDPGEIVHHRPITAKTRREYQAYLVRLAAEVSEKLTAEGKTPAEVEAGVLAAVRNPPHKLERPKAGTTRLRGTALVDPTRVV